MGKREGIVLYQLIAATDKQSCSFHINGWLEVVKSIHFLVWHVILILLDENLPSCIFDIPIVHPFLHNFYDNSGRNWIYWSL